MLSPETVFESLKEEGFDFLKQKAGPSGSIVQIRQPYALFSIGLGTVCEKECVFTLIYN